MATTSGPGFPAFALRDSLLVAGTGLAWWLLHGAAAGTGPLADFLGLLLGLAFGASVYLLHEWGHTLGALATGSVIAPARSLRAISLFSFDSRRNDRRQFAAMSLSGFVVTAVAVWFVYGVLPDELLASRVARGATLVLASLTVFIEFPLLAAGLITGRIPPVEAFDTGSVAPPAREPSA